MTPSAGAVRRARRRDLDRLVALWVAVAGHHARLEPHFALRPGAEGSLREILEAELSDPSRAFFVQEDGGEILGFCSAHVSTAPPVLAETARAEITDIFVEEAARRRGVGRALVEETLSWIRGRGVSRVEVRVISANAEGQAFWRALGFGDLVDVLHRRL